MRIRFFLLLFAVVIISACSEHIADKPISLNLDDSGKVIKVYVGQSFDINLIENSEDGGVWSISPYNTAVIGFISSKFIPDEKIDGAGGHRVIRFRALKKGKSVLEINYFKTAKRAISKLGMFRVDINVANDRDKD